MLQSELETAMTTMAVALDTFQTSKKRALQGELFFTEMEVVVQQLQSEIKTNEKEIFDLKNQKTIVQEQFQCMQVDRGVSA